MARNTNYSRIRKPSRTAEQVKATNDGPKIYIFKKLATVPVRIRTGPGATFDHNGSYVNRSKIEVLDIKNGWGLLKEYESGRDGWVNLEFFENENS